MSNSKLNCKSVIKTVVISDEPDTSIGLGTPFDIVTDLFRDELRGMCDTKYSELFNMLIPKVNDLNYGQVIIVGTGGECNSDWLSTPFK